MSCAYLYGQAYARHAEIDAHPLLTGYGGKYLLATYKFPPGQHRDIWFGLEYEEEGTGT